MNHELCFAVAGRTRPFRNEPFENGCEFLSGLQQARFLHGRTPDDVQRTRKDSIQINLIVNFDPIDVNIRDLAGRFRDHVLSVRGNLVAANDFSSVV